MAADRTTLPLRLPRQNSDYFSSSTRPRLAGVTSPPDSPSSPRTPSRPFLFTRPSASALNSPSLAFRPDDDVLVLDFTSTAVRVGLAGEERPRATQHFGPAQGARVGDHGAWVPSAPVHKRRKVERVEEWGRERELWQMDLRGVDLGLVEDKLERAVRVAIRDHILVQDDSKRRSFIVAVPPLLPQPLLSSLLRTMFNQCPFPATVTVLSQPTLCAISAGLRSALVVDIGWQETVVAAIYEYSEVQYRRSSRALKQLSWETRAMLAAEIARQGYSEGDAGFDDVEEVLKRMVWTRRRNPGADDRDQELQGKSITVKLPGMNGGKPLRIPFGRFSDPTETALLGAAQGKDDFDDDDLPLPILIYRSLLSLPVDVRGVCAQRLLFVGDGAAVPGLKSRLLDELSSTVSARGWDPVHSYGSGKPPKSSSQPRQVPAAPTDQEPAGEESNKDLNPDSTVPAHLQAQLPDTVLSKIQTRDRSSSSKTNTTGDKDDLLVKGYHSLGAWAGASMVAGLRVRGLVELERERFMQYGLMGGDDTAKKRQSMYIQGAGLPGRPPIATPGPGGNKGDRNSWNLGVWA